MKEKLWNIPFVDKDISEILKRELGIGELLASVLSSRGINTPEKAERFLKPSLKYMTSPYIFSDMKKSTQLLSQSILKNTPIGIFGDADADGISSAAVITLFLKDFGYKNIIWRIPSRDKEGYGLTKDFVEECAVKNVKTLIITDCGAKNHKEIKYAKELGIETIVCDHHLIDTHNPPQAFAVLHPQLISERTGLDYLSGTGVAFELVVGLRRELENIGRSIPDPKNYLDIVSLGTIGDMVPLVEDNRIFVKKGIDNLNNLGLRKISEMIKEQMGQAKLKSEDFRMKIVPRINSAGRTGDPSISFKLLTCDIPKEVDELSKDLEQRNSERKKITEEIMQEIETKFKFDEERFSYVLWGSDWQEGVLGLVATRIVEKTSKPVCLLSAKNDIAKGSLRSPEFLDIYRVLERVSPILLKFGGHRYAAGIVLETKRIEEFSEILENEIRRILPKQFKPIENADAEVNLESVTKKEVEELENLEPFGEGNEKPTFIANAYIQESKVVGKEEKHLRISIKGKDCLLSAIGFDMADKPLIDRKKIVLRYKNEFGYDFELLDVIR